MGKEFEPRSKLRSKVENVNPIPHFCKFGELSRSPREDAAEALPVSSLVVMERRRYLDQAMEEELIVTLRFQPKRLERLVGFKKLLRVEEVNALSDGGVHTSCIVARPAGRVSKRLGSM